MSRWDVEQADHVFDNTTSRPGPIIRSRHIDTEAVTSETTHAAHPDVMVCPTCGQKLPALAVVCPDDGALLAQGSSQE
ncbi:MAG TPA: hypothetical protein VHF25_01830 [Nitriliruptorales bacterium]|nr:hypothetical protein [Nitriliruptorales bacterium]